MEQRQHQQQEAAAATITTTTTTTKAVVVVATTTGQERTGRRRLGFRRKEMKKVLQQEGELCSILSPRSLCLLQLLHKPVCFFRIRVPFFCLLERSRLRFHIPLCSFPGIERIFIYIYIFPLVSANLALANPA
jgi:hypothetical protein